MQITWFFSNVGGKAYFISHWCSFTSFYVSLQSPLNQKEKSAKVMSKNTDTEQKKYKPIAPQVPQLCNVTEVGVARNGENPQLKYPLLFKGEHKWEGKYITYVTVVRAQRWCSRGTRGKRMSVWKNRQRWNRLHKSRWREIKEKGRLSRFPWRTEEAVWCSITGASHCASCVNVSFVWTLPVRTHVWMRLVSMRGYKSSLTCCVCSCLHYVCTCKGAQRCESHAWVPTSKRWELTFLPFFIQVILGFGSPVAWHTNDATPPEMPVWSSGDLTKLGKPEEDEVKGTE